MDIFAGRDGQAARNAKAAGWPANPRVAAWGALAWLLCACVLPPQAVDPTQSDDGGRPLADGGPLDGGLRWGNERTDGGGPDASNPAGSMSAWDAFEWEGYRYWLYRPSHLPEGVPAPLVMMLHGCQQTATEIQEDTALTEWAEREKFWAVFPEQKLSQQPLRCWRWYDAAHQQRDAGEPAALRGIVEEVRARHAIDDDRVFVAGMSAGAAMAVILTTVYSDVFRKGFALAGLAFRAAESELEIESAMRAGVEDPIAKGVEAFQALAAGAEMASLFVMHGDADGVVLPVNGEHLITQWTTCADLHWDGIANEDVQALASETLLAATAAERDAVLRKYVLPSGDVIAASLWVHGLGHKWPGATSGNPHTDPLGPSATGWMWNFFRGTLP